MNAHQERAVWSLERALVVLSLFPGLELLDRAFRESGYAYGAGLVVLAVIVGFLLAHPQYQLLQDSDREVQ